MSVPVTIDLPSGYRRVAWAGRMGRVAVVTGKPQRPRGAALLVPGLTGSKEDYFAILGGLYERGWAATAVDLPGMYQSQGSDDQADYTLAHLVGDVAAMLPLVAEGSPVHLVGHSTGGLIARHVALQHAAQVLTLTMYDSGCGQLTAPARATTVTMRDLLRSGISPAEVYRSKQQLDLAAGRPAPAAPIEQFLQQRWHSTTAAHLIGMAQVVLSAPDVMADLARVAGSGQLPVLALYGEHDDATWPHECFARLASQATRAVVIPDAEHSPAVENPAATVDALDGFWRDHS